MKKGIILLLCIAVIGGGGFFGYRQYKKAQDNKIVVKVVPVSLMATTADMYSYSDSDLYGYITAANQQLVNVDTEKLIKKVNVKVGDAVKKGDTILEYDMTVVELELAQKQNQVKVIEQNIKAAQKELARYQTLQPSEYAPQDNNNDNDYDYDNEPVDDNYDEPVYIDDTQEPAQTDNDDVNKNDQTTITPVETVKLVSAAMQFSQKGTKEDPYIINCNEQTVVQPSFITRLLSTNKYAELHVYSDKSEFLYKWLINRNEIKTGEFKDWVVSDGVTIDTETGIITLDTQKRHYGYFSVQGTVYDNSDSEDNKTEDNSEDTGDVDIPDDTDIPDDMDIPDDTDDYDYLDNNYNNTTDDNYMYSKSELANMINEKKQDISQLQIDKKNAEIDYNSYKKQKTDGKVVAKIDGIVKKIGSVDGTDSDAEPSSDETADEEYSEQSGGYDEAFAVIEGDGGVEVQCDVPEMKLSDYQVGAAIDITSYNTGMTSVAEVTEIKEEPSSYTNLDGMSNPNSSMYTVLAKVYDSSELTVGEGVSVSVAQMVTDESDSLYIPIHYVRQEDGEYYIMKADKKNHLVKQYVKTGAVMYGSEIEIKAGISMSDKICFPYGTSVKEGVKTKDTTEVLYPENYNGYY